LKDDFQLGHGHAMAIYALLKGTKREGTARKCSCVSDEQGFHILLGFFPSLAKGPLTALTEIWLMSDVLLDRIADRSAHSVQ